MSLETLEQLDNFAALRNGIRQLAEAKEEWAGVPMPLEGHQLVVESQYPNAAALMMFGAEPPEPIDEAADIKVRNSFWSTWRRTTIVIGSKAGKIRWNYVAPANNATQQLLTLGASVAWGIEQEAKAIQLLGTLVKHHTFKHYLLTGSFLETSDRSGLTYMFRRLRPTLVISSRDKHGTPGKELRILCALCLHPIGYYSGSWAGAMTPTDDVLAHLMLMRGAEEMFWRRSNQHPPNRPEAGL